MSRADTVTVKFLFFVTLWTAIGAFMAFLIVGLIVNAEHWWQERRR